MSPRDRRLLKFMLLGLLLGGALAAVLGYAFGSGIPDTLAMEMTIYVVVGAIAGFFFGLIAHVLTYHPDERPASIADTPSLGKGFGGSNGGVAGGVLLMVVAIVWFAAGLAANRIFFYPPLMFLIGVVSAVKGSFRSE